MKTEINNENKAKFFAQYWGQRIVNWDNNSVGLGLVNSGYINDVGIWLELKPLSDISDEDLTAIEFNFPNGKRPSDFSIQFFPDSYDVHWIAKSGDGSIRGNLRLSNFDTLRDRGYLVPFMGLSCEEIIEAGWAKYKEP